MADWHAQLKFDPILVLLNAKVKPIQYFIKREFLNEEVAPIEPLWKLPEALKIISKQRDDGSWKYPGQIKSLNEDYAQIETFKMLRQLIPKYEFTKEHPTIQKAAAFMFSRQTEEGDFRGIYETQYSPNYTGAIMALLIKAGYEAVPEIEQGFQWLLSKRQNDGGWAAPLRTLKIRWEDAVKHTEPLQPDKTKPFSHLMTGMVLYAFAAHPKYRKSKEARHAGDLIKSRFFKSDSYSDRRSSKKWERLQYPFWWVNYLSMLDTLSLLGFSKEDPQIKKVLDWFIDTQANDGLWETGYSKANKPKDLEARLWITLAVCRIFKTYFG